MSKLKTVAEQAPQLAKSIISDVKAGSKSEGLQWSKDIESGKATIKEMIGTDDGSAEFVEKVTYDLYSGREAVPLVYKQLYATRSDRNFPKTMTTKEFGPVQVVFVKKYEGGEVKFGTIGPESEKVVNIATYASGIEYNEDIIEFNHTWRVSEIGEAFGEAYNKLLNHMHMNPIIAGSFTTTGGGLAAQYTAQNAGTAQEIAYDTSIETTLMNALQVLPKGSKILCNSFDVPQIEAALAGAMYEDNTSNLVKRTLRPSDLITYNGDEVEVGAKTYEYAGVTSSEAFLVTPKKQLKEYVKHGLRIDSNDGDLSRLVLTQIVGRSRRGVLAALGGKQGTVKINLS